jgi:asparaginyl-tRNA synthetase
MTGRTRIRQVLEQGKVGAEITVAGWARSVRAGKGVTFIALNDGSCLSGIQVVVRRNCPIQHILWGFSTQIQSLIFL